MSCIFIMSIESVYDSKVKLRNQNCETETSELELKVENLQDYILRIVKINR